MGPPSGLQLDLLTVIVRLEQIRDEWDEHQGFAEDLLLSRVIGCDVPRLRSYLAPETLAWAEDMS